MKYNLSSGVSISTVIHEICHALGMHHEHQRFDRDSYINVNISNVATGDQHNFTKITSNYFAVGSFDFSSIMIYGSDAFAIDPNIYVMTRKDNGNPFWDNSSLSTLDRSWINGLHLPYIARVDAWADLAPTVYKADNTIMTSLERENLIRSLNNGNLPPPPPVITGPNVVYTPSSTFYLSASLGCTIYWSLSGPFGFSSGNFIETGNSATVYNTAASNSTGTLKARLGSSNGPIIDTKVLTQCALLYGDPNVYTGSNITVYLTNPPTSYSWNYSSNLTFVSSSTNPHCATFKAVSTGTGTVSIMYSGGPLPSHSFSIFAANPISGPDKVCYTGSATYTLPSGTTASNWDIDPKAYFSITSSNSTSATVTTSVNNGCVATLRAVINGQTFIKNIAATCN